MPEIGGAEPEKTTNSWVRFVPVDHWKSGDWRLKIWNTLAFQGADVNRPQIRSAKSDAGHPWGNALSSGEEDVFCNNTFDELLFKRLDLFRVAFIEKNPQVALRS